MKRTKNMSALIVKIKKPIAVLLPILISIYPATVVYAENAHILQITSWIRMIGFQALLGLLTFISYSAIQRKVDYYSAISSAIFLIFFNVYGLLFSKLVQFDAFQVTHYSLLPLYLLISVTVSLVINRFSDVLIEKVWQILSFILTILIAYNLIVIIPTEIAKINNSLNSGREITIDNPNSQVDSPDIYYIIFDEFSGFPPMKEYWGFEGVDEFVKILEEKGFQVTDNSHASSIDTLHQMASRLNYRNYPLGGEYSDTYFKDISDNRAMQFLKARGYTTIVFDETKVSFAYPAKPSIIADINYENDPESMNSDSSGSLFDDYGSIVADKTMLLVFEDLYKIHNPELQKHKNMIYFTVSEMGELEKSEQPIFVYAHLMIPHMPFMFDENGNIVEPAYHQNWDYYLGNYKFAINIAEKLVNNILSQYPADDLPIIILQSDHGARNKGTSNLGSKILEGFDEEYKTSILNAILLPGCEKITLSDDFNPINTFPVVFDCAFGVDVPVE
jgi:hypothetical protein